MRVTQQTKSATRQRILDEAKKLFAGQGFEATTTRDIARTAQVAVGTLFNYFPTKESIVASLVGEAWTRAAAEFAAKSGSAALASAAAPAAAHNAEPQTSEPPSLEEDLFAHVAAILRKLKPYRKYLPAMLERALSPLAANEANHSEANHSEANHGEANHDQASLRIAHLETVGQIIARHGRADALTAVALHLYWTLYTGVLAFWAQDRSPRQEDTLALLDQSLAMYAGWLTSQADQLPNDSPTYEG